MFLLLLLALQAQPPRPTATIRGRVTAGDIGAPLKGAQVVLVADSGRQAYSTADETGQYEIKNLTPGEYQAYANKPGYLYPDPPPTVTLAENQELNDVNFTLPRGGVISGVVTDDYGEPLPDVFVEAVWKSYFQGKMQLNTFGAARTDDRGQFRIFNLHTGRYYIKAIQEIGANLAPHYRSVMYPNVSHIADAQVIRLRAGGEAGGIKLVMQETPMVTIRGKVVDDRTGQPVAKASLKADPDDYGGAKASTQAGPDGAFRLAWLTPGSYTIEVKSSQSTERSLAVPEHNLSGVTIAIGPGATIKGTVAADGGTLPGKLTVVLAANSVEFDEPMAPDGSFQVSGVQPGTYAFSIQAPRGSKEKYQPFYVSSITVGGRDVTDSISVAEGVHAMEVRAHIDFRTGAISGRTLSADGNSLVRATVVLIAADPRTRNDMRYFRDFQSDEHGAYEMDGLIPGDYLLLVWPSRRGDMVLDPDVMALVEKYCVPVSVGASGKVTQELRLIPDVQKVASDFSQQ